MSRRPVVPLTTNGTDPDRLLLERDQGNKAELEPRARVGADDRS
jgi:hypothetical protein